MANDDECPSSVADDEPTPDEPPEDPTSAATRQAAGRRLPGGPAERTEKALGLEVARLFSLSPRLLIAPASPPERGSAGDDRAVNEPAAEREDQRTRSDPSPHASDP
jgi:hypothetical protein